MTYFRHDAPLHEGAAVELSGEEARHLLGSRRMRPGERFALQDPAGRRFAAELLVGERGRARALIRDALPVPPLPTVRVTLLQAAVKDKAAETLIEKCTELGVAALCFFPAAHSAVAHKGLESPRLHARWERIAWEACKQSDRQFPPALSVAPTLADALARHPAQPEGGVQGWLLHPGAARPVAQALGGTRPTAVHLLIGPEGGLTDAECRAAEDAGYTPRGLGATVLRAETAALAACTLALLGWG
jgi:16S rRNA (uracil1498-N3)-methyltransferase